MKRHKIYITILLIGAVLLLISGIYDIIVGKYWHGSLVVLINTYSIYTVIGFFKRLKIRKRLEAELHNMKTKFSFYNKEIENLN